MNSQNLKIDVSSWKMKDYVRFFMSAKESDFEALFKMMASAIESWDYPYDPRLPDSYGELDPSEWQDVLEVFGNELSLKFQRRNIK